MNGLYYIFIPLKTQGADICISLKNVQKVKISSKVPEKQLHVVLSKRKRAFLSAGCKFFLYLYGLFCIFFSVRAASCGSCQKKQSSPVRKSPAFFMIADTAVRYDRWCTRRAAGSLRPAQYRSPRRADNQEYPAGLRVCVRPHCGRGRSSRSAPYRSRAW